MNNWIKFFLWLFVLACAVGSCFTSLVELRSEGNYQKSQNIDVSPVKIAKAIGEGGSGGEGGDGSS